MQLVGRLQMFGVIRINKSSSLEWSRCIGIRNSHDQTLAVGLTAGISVCVCSNLCFGGSMVLKRRHTSRIELEGLVTEAIDALGDEFLTLETVAEDLKLQYVRDDAARAAIVKAAEAGAVNSCDIIPVFREFKNPSHPEFEEPTRWSLLNAFTENAKKYSPARADICHRGLTRLFGLDGNSPTLWKCKRPVSYMSASKSSRVPGELEKLCGKRRPIGRQQGFGLICRS